MFFIPLPYTFLRAPASVSWRLLLLCVVYSATRLARYISFAGLIALELPCPVLRTLGSEAELTFGTMSCCKPSSSSGGKYSAKSLTKEDQGTKLNDVVVLLHDPGPHPDVELVFIHGFQLNEGEKDVFWTTWLSTDGAECWPATWLQQAEGFPVAARVLSIKYDASVRKSATEGRFDLDSLGESLLQQMYLGKARIGQNKCPVVFVCHSVGGLVAKRLVLTAQDHVAHDEKAQILLGNLKGFFFYATPHSGSDLFSWLRPVPKAQRGLLFNAMKELNTSTHRINSEFMGLSRRCEFKDEWTFDAVGESCSLVVKDTEGPAVKYASSRHIGIDNFVEVQNTDHFTVCRPADKLSSNFLLLQEFVVKIHERCLSEAGQLR